MFAFAAIVSLICLAVPVSIFVRMVITGPRVRAEIHAHMSEHRRTCCGPHIPTDTQGAASSAKTLAAPCNPAPSNGNEVTSS